MAEATPSGREGLLAGMIRLGVEKRAAHRGRFALPWCGPVAGRDERPHSSAWGMGLAGAKGMEEAKTMSSFFALEKATIVR
ncbi:MAG: hypothetical protein PHF70_08900 [Opitutales bacterium]|nr:hypothetical protein [Opitutales bacterium]